MRVAFRVDASAIIGSGHVMRCRALAAILRARGVKTQFITRAHAGHLADLLRGDGHAVSLLPAPQADVTLNSSYAAWLGAPSEVDAAETIGALGGHPDWLVVDHYAIDAAWQARLRPHAAKLLVIDDLADRAHDCDALVDQNFSLSAAARYAGRLPAGCLALLGPHYALLGPSYANIAARTVRPRVARILVSFGGGDPGNLTGLTLEALSGPAFADVHVDAVIGAISPHREAVAALAARRPRTTLHGPRPTLADLMAAADLAIGAGGGTTWERCRCGLPSIVISIANNQEPASRDLGASGLIRYLGREAEVTPAKLREAVADLCGDASARAAMAEHGSMLVDGLGAARVAEALISTDSGGLSLRPATAADRAFYYHLANEPSVRGQAFHSAPIAWETHRDWFDGKFKDRDTLLFVLTVGALPVGQIRFDYVSALGGLTIDYALEPFVRGRGWGKRLVAMGIAALPPSRPAHIYAEVKRDNAASCAVFEALGFRVDTTEAADRVTYHLQRPAA